MYDRRAADTTRRFARTEIQSPTYKSGDLLHPLGPGILVEQLQRLDQGEGEGPEAEGEDEEGLERLDGLRNEGPVPLPEAKFNYLDNSQFSCFI